MKINKTILNNNHWTTDYIPISYKKLSKKQFERSLTFFWDNNYELNAIIRTYFINNNNIEIGDFWLQENLRGKKINNQKISYLFLKKIISKIWKYYPSCNTPFQFSFWTLLKRYHNVFEKSRFSIRDTLLHPVKTMNTDVRRRPCYIKNITIQRLK